MKINDGAFADVDEEADVDAASAGGNVRVNEISWVVGEEILRGRRDGDREMGNEEKRKGGGFTLERVGCSRLCYLFGSKWLGCRIFRRKRGRGLDQ